ncbi:hypothetical protein JD844_023268 [Phrynosoma platyrhinos]|uniref:Uncharacterized protein n=1 Tax=Phrynosoma platyrhinos TaxID=52577 RepID=A0ABQ7SWH2_PHRPL|nr:hypothetical protein JD844_023268 [Phrynosoma platyrhinos]
MPALMFMIQTPLLSPVMYSPTVAVDDAGPFSPSDNMKLFSDTETLLAEKDKKKEEDSEQKPAPAHSTPPPPQLSDTEDFTGLETTSLLQHEDTVLHISEDNGMENPLLSSQFSFAHVEVGQTDIDLDESHV